MLLTENRKMLAETSTKKSCWASLLSDILPCHRHDNSDYIQRTCVAEEVHLTMVRSRLKAAGLRLGALSPRVEAPRVPSTRLETIPICVAEEGEEVQCDEVSLTLLRSRLAVASPRLKAPSHWCKTASPHSHLLNKFPSRTFRLLSTTPTPRNNHLLPWSTSARGSKPKSLRLWNNFPLSPAPALFSCDTTAGRPETPQSPRQSRAANKSNLNIISRKIDQTLVP